MKRINSGDYLGEEQDLQSIPARGEYLPPLGNRLTQRLAAAVLWLLGWRLVGRIPDLKKLIAIGAPHTSNWDWILVMLSAYALGLRISWLAKKSVFDSPAGGLMRYFGGVPVDRSGPQGIVGQSVERLKDADKLLLCITPEGTRSRVNQWKRGFYYIALEGGVPITLVSFDFGNKIVGFGPTIYPTGDIEGDIGYIQGLYSTVEPRHPEKYL